jgi:DNA-binding response OmpR family regulator
MTPNSAYRLLLVDDDVALAGTLAAQLAADGAFAPTLAHSGMAALGMLEREDFSLILLDVGLPDIDGRDVCRILRRRGLRTPIVMLSGAASDADTVLSLNAGAGDYVAKPVRLPVLLARLRAQLRQYTASDAAHFAVGGFTFRSDSRRLVSADGQRKAMLTPKEAEILKHLCRSRGALVGRDSLVAAVWGRAGSARRRRLEAHVGRLQQKLQGERPADSILLAENDGYRLM